MTNKTLRILLKAIVAFAIMPLLPALASQENLLFAKVSDTGRPSP